MLVKLLALVLPLGLDTFAVAAALGVAGLSSRRRTRVSLLMAGFEAAMPLLGLAVGAPLGRAVGSGADYVAIAVLIAFGIYTLVADDDEDESAEKLAVARGWGAVVLGLSISLDELAVGFTFGLLRLPVVPVVVLIGVQALLVSQLGMRLGAHLSTRAREGAERLAGCALIALGIGLLLARLLG